ncbi:hypothetical protein V8F06_012819 [Rhypophila decipiens]
MNPIAAKMFRHVIDPNRGGHRTLNYAGEEPSSRDILVQDNAIPLSMPADFMLFLTHNKLPNGRESTLPMLTPEEFRLFARPYNEWAPPPHNNTLRGEAGAIVFMHVFTGLDDMFDFAAIFSGRGGPLEGSSFLKHDLHFAKTRAWSGLVPLSERRWREKGVDTPKNLLKGLEHIDLIQVFDYFSEPSVVSIMRKTYNRAYDQLVRFDTILAAYHAQQPAHLRPDPSRRGRAAHLWAEFFFSHVQFITARAHAWATKHTKALFELIFSEVTMSPPVDGGGTTADRESQLPVAGPGVPYLEQILVRHTRTGYLPLITLTGFKNDLPHWRYLSSPPLVNWADPGWADPRVSRRPLPGGFPPEMARRTQVFRTRLLRLAADHCGAADTARFQRIMFESIAQASNELRGQPPMEIVEELWVTRLRAMMMPPPPAPSSAQPLRRQPPPTKWGFLAYRLTSSSSSCPPEKWSAFQSAFTADIIASLSPDNVLGATEDIRDSFTITWIDGSEHNIPANDIFAARTHFTALRARKDPLLETLLTVDAFLAVDEHSLQAYLSPPSERTIPGQNLVDAEDLTPGFVAVVDTEHAPSPPQQPGPRRVQRADDDEKRSAGYVGWVYVAGAVLLDDLWPSLFLRTANDLRAMWPMAAMHPAGVYMGVAARYQERGWEWFNNLRAELVREAMGRREESGSGGRV